MKAFTISFPTSFFFAITSLKPCDFWTLPISLERLSNFQNHLFGSNAFLSSDYKTNWNPVCFWSTIRRFQSSLWKNKSLATPPSGGDHSGFLLLHCPSAPAKAIVLANVGLTHGQTRTDPTRWVFLKHEKRKKDKHTTRPADKLAAFDWEGGKRIKQRYKIQHRSLCSASNQTRNHVLKIHYSYILLHNWIYIQFNGKNDYLHLKIGKRPNAGGWLGQGMGHKTQDFGTGASSLPPNTT